MGVSPVTQATPNKGYAAAAKQRVGMLLKMAVDALPMAESDPELGKALQKVIETLAKVAGPGSSSPAAERNEIDRMAMKNAQNAQTMQQMKPSAAGGQGAPPPGGQPPGGGQGMAA